MADVILSSNERLLELVGELDHYAETEGYERGYPGGLYSGQRQRARAELEAGIRALTSHETLQPHQDLALARINHLACKGRFDEADAQLFRDAIVHRPGSVPHHHIWSVNGPPRDPDPEQVCDFGCGLKWKDRQEAEAHAQKANSCVCGEPNSPGTHRTDGPCLAPIGDHHP